MASTFKSHPIGQQSTRSYALCVVGNLRMLGLCVHTQNILCIIHSHNPRTSCNVSRLFYRPNFISSLVLQCSPHTNTYDTFINFWQDVLKSVAALLLLCSLNLRENMQNSCRDIHFTLLSGYHVSWLILNDSAERKSEVGHNSETVIIDSISQILLFCTAIFHANCCIWK